MSDYLQYLDPEVVDKLGRLEVKARLIVEGFLQGAHQSPYRGVSVEFAQHREYAPGDDLRHLDWKVFGRTDRFYIKQYEEETNLRCILALDVSGSMRFPEVKNAKRKEDEYQGVTRFRYATMLAAALGLLLLRQRDAAGLATFDTRITQWVDAHNNPAHLANLLKALDNGPGEEDRVTSFLPALAELAERTGRRGMIVVISDLFGPVNETLAGLARLRSRGHDVIVFHLLSPEELRFEFTRNTLYRFVGLENTGAITVDPRALRADYLEAMGEFRRELQRGCLKERVEYHLVDTGTNLAVPLTTVLARRLRRKGKR